MKDKLIDFIERHRVLSRFILIIVTLFLILCIIRWINLSRKGNTANDEPQTTESIDLSSSLAEVTEAPTNTEPENPYKSSLGLNVDDDSDNRVEVPDVTPTSEPTPYVEQTEPKYEVTVNVYDNTGVPKKNVDGSSCKAYLDKVSLKDFGTFWGSALTQKDFKGHKKYLIGVTQNKDDFEKGDCESVGWLIDNIKKLKDNDAIKFTNLHVIGSLSDTHVALLCSYDWYSVYGLKDTLVVFEDISNTLSQKDFKDGDIFSATVFKHNVKVLNDVGGQRVVVVQYNIFN